MRVTQLVIRRAVGESIVIGPDDNKVTVIIGAIEGDRVRLVVHAAESVEVDRIEVREDKVKNGRRKSL